jgi:hypothetical protein
MTAHPKHFDYSVDSGSELRTLAAELLYAAADFGHKYPEAAEALRGAAYELERLAKFESEVVDFPIPGLAALDYAVAAKN